jgi:DNA-binding transcriptional MerR regulator/methylmalonyl-CoA mutase cobalamin-binding subunit
MTDEQGHSMKIASMRTGLSPHVLRVWERRYGAVHPTRTPTNRRIYSDADLERLRLLGEATKVGHKISRIADLSSADLAVLVEEDLQYRRPGNVPLGGRHGDVERCLSRCLDAVKQLDTESLEEDLSRAAVEFDQPTLLDEVIPTLMEEIGSQWQSGALRIADEHMATAVVRTFLGTVNGLQRLPRSAPCMIVTTPLGQIHEIGALLAASSATAQGWRAHYLGPDLPASEIAGAARRNGAQAVALSIIYPADDPRIAGELTRLRKGLGESVALLFGGRAAAGYTEAIAQVGGLFFEELAALRKEIEDPQHLTRR